MRRKQLYGENKGKRDAETTGNVTRKMRRGRTNLIMPCNERSEKRDPVTGHEREIETARERKREKKRERER